MWLVVPDAYSKWPEIHMMEANTTKTANIEKLQDIFAVYRLPEIIVSNNAAQFTAQQFGSYCTSTQAYRHTSIPSLS